MPNAKSPAGQRLGTETSPVDQKIVQVLEQTVETEVLKRIGEPLRAVVHDAVREAIVAASHVEEVPAESTAEEAARTSNEPRRPKAGGRCAAVWDELDQLHKDDGVPSLKQIMAVGKRRKWNENNTRVEYYQWRRAHGIHGRNPFAAASNEVIVDRRKSRSAGAYAGPERRIGSRRETDRAAA